MDEHQAWRDKLLEEIRTAPLIVICGDGYYFRANPTTYEPLHTTRYGVPEGGRRMDLGEWQLHRVESQIEEMKRGRA